MSCSAGVSLPRAVEVARSASSRPSARQAVSLARARVAPGVATPTLLGLSKPSHLFRLPQRRHQSGIAPLAHLAVEASPSDVASSTTLSSSSASGSITSKSSRHSATGQSARVAPAVYQFENDVYEDSIARRISQSSWNDLPLKKSSSKPARARSASQAPTSGLVKAAALARIARGHSRPTGAPARRMTAGSGSASTVALIQSSFWRKLGPVPLPIERKHELMSLELTATRGMRPAQLEEYLKLPHPAELAPTHLPISDWQIFQIDWCPDRPFEMELDELAACKRAWERTPRGDVDRIIARFRTTHPEILPPDAPVWGGPSKTAKMSPAARGVFIRQWYARPENQIDMFVGSGGSGIVGRKMAFDVAYTGATAAEVQACEKIAASRPAQLRRECTEVYAAWARDNQEIPEHERPAAFAEEFPEFAVATDEPTKDCV